nr:unnamed protein product [Callosobruchus analis]
MLTPLLSKTVKEVAEQTTPTELLFGDNLRDQIKTARRGGKNILCRHIIVIVSGKPEPLCPSTPTCKGDVATQRAPLTETILDGEGQVQPQEIEVRYAGRLQHFYNNWLKIAKDEIVLNWITGYTIPFSKLPNPNVMWSLNHQQVIYLISLLRC